MMWFKDVNGRLVAIPGNAIFEVQKIKGDDGATHGYGLAGSRKIHFAVGTESEMGCVASATEEALSKTTGGMHHVAVEKVAVNIDQMEAVVYRRHPSTGQLEALGSELVPVPIPEPEPVPEPPAAPPALSDDPDDPESDAMSAAS